MSSISHNPEHELRIDRAFGMVSGLVAALAMLTVVVLFRRITGVSSLLDALADAVLLAMPMSTFSFMLDTFGTQAKTLLLIGLIAMMLLLGMVLGRWFASQTLGSKRVRTDRATVYAICVFLVSALFVWIILSVNVPAELRGDRFWKVMLSLGVASLVFSMVLATCIAALRRLRSGTAQEANPGRRRLISLGAMGVAILAGSLVLGGEVLQVAGRKISGAITRGVMPLFITPVPDFYTVSKNFVDPDPDRGSDWSVEVFGLVNNAGFISRAELESMQAPEFISTLTCISNEIAGPLIGTARWTGAPLGEVLQKFGVREDAKRLVMEGEDGYTDSIPIEKALAPETMIVWKMNGEPLPNEHGEPVRIIVPGLYGIKNVKWLTSMKVLGAEYRGFWQERGWTNDGTIKTQSVISIPAKRDVLEEGPTEIQGYAFAGDRGISRVEVSTDGGSTWMDATITERPSELSWVFWSARWVAQSGSYDLVVRATDGTGEVQTEEEASTLPDGASGWHSVTVSVV